MKELKLKKEEQAMELKRGPLTAEGIMTARREHQKNENFNTINEGSFGRVNTLQETFGRRNDADLKTWSRESLEKQGTPRNNQSAKTSKPPTAKASQ